MVRSLTSSAVFIDTSAIIALRSPSDQYHTEAKGYFEKNAGVRWIVLNATTHESYTRIRYDQNYRNAISAYDWLKGRPFFNVRFESSDEEKARDILKKYNDQVLSYHDALCAAIMIRIGMYRIFSFDSHFWVFGFRVEPGITK